MLRCTQISFSYQGVVRLDNVQLQIDEGGMLALFGHNGSGKSTLLKMLGGSLPVRDGCVLWHDRSVIGSDGYLKRAVRKHIGVLFQGSSSDDKLSALDNLIFSARLYGLDKKTAEAKAHEVIEFAALSDRAREPIKKLSHGMRRRLELYRCFMHEPKLLILDEPTAGLDVNEIKKFFDFLVRYKEQNRASIIMASHHGDELIFADHVAMMSEGKIIEYGTPASMLLRLDYLRCSFNFENADANSLKDLPLFDLEHSDDGAISAKLKSDQLDNFLKSSLVRNASFKSLAIEKPSLADVYRDLVAGARDA